ncbi:MFS transporter [Candidatus Woesearchaeota archaeon]|nr:MFS transporter [Candidatus Woesearchaeota archaeon]
MVDDITKIKLIYFFKSLWFFAPILTLFYLSRELTLFQIVSLEAILLATVIVAEVPTGFIADRIGRKNSLFFLIGLYIIGNVITIYAHSYWLFALTEVFFGIAIAFGSGAIEALVYDLLKQKGKERSMTRVWGNIQAYSLLAGFFATIIGGFLARNESPEVYALLLWLYSIGAAIAFIIIFFLKKEEVETYSGESQFTVIKQGFTLITKNKNLRMIILLNMLTMPFYHVMKFLIQPHLLNTGVPVMFFGIIVGAVMLIEAFGSQYAHRIEQQFGIKKTLLLATITPGLIYIFLGLIFHWSMAIIGYIIFAGAAFMRTPLFAQYTNIHLPTKNRATLLSFISMILSIYLVAMRLIIGKVADFGIPHAFVLMGIIITIGAVFLRIDERQLKTTEHQ